MCFALIFLGGQTSRILSTVGSAVDVTQNGSGSGADTSGGDADEDGAGSGAGTGAGSGAAGDAGAGSATGPQVADAAATIPTLLIVRTGDLTLEVHDLDAAVRDGDAAVVRAGGYVSDSTRARRPAKTSANVTYRIPSAHWNATLEVLHGIAAKVDKEEIKTEEVTGQVVDLTARIANLRATEAALQAIMARAAKISDVLDVQRQLTTTRGEIEQLVAKKQHLEEQASFGSLAVRFHLPVVPAPAATPAPAPGWDPGVGCRAGDGEARPDRPDVDVNRDLAGDRRRAARPRRARHRARELAGLPPWALAGPAARSVVRSLRSRRSGRRHLGGDLQDPLDVEVLGDQRLDQGDLLRVGGVGLHEQVVDLRRDDVGVLGDDRREQVGLADRSEDRHRGAGSRRSARSPIAAPS